MVLSEPIARPWAGTREKCHESVTTTALPRFDPSTSSREPHGFSVSTRLVDHPTLRSPTVRPTSGSAISPFGGSPLGRVHRLHAARPGPGTATPTMASRHQEPRLNQAALGMRSHDVLDPAPDLGDHLDPAGHQSVLEFTGNGAADQDIDAELRDNPLAVGAADWIDLCEGRLTADDVNDHKPLRHVEERRHSAFPSWYGESHAPAIAMILPTLSAALSVLRCSKKYSYERTNETRHGCLAERCPGNGGYRRISRLMPVGSRQFQPRLNSRMRKTDVILRSGATKGLGGGKNASAPHPPRSFDSARWASLRMPR